MQTESQFSAAVAARCSTGTPDAKRGLCIVIARRGLGMVVVLLLIAACWSVPGAVAQTSEPVVPAVLFFSPDCSHCRLVMAELPGFFEENGGPGQVWNETGLPQEEVAFFAISNENLEFLMVNTALTLGKSFYEQHTVDAGIPDGRLGVPRLAIAGYVLVGSREILEVLPDAVERSLEEGGALWPYISGLPAVLGSTGMPTAVGMLPADVLPVTPVVTDAAETPPGGASPDQPDPGAAGEPADDPEDALPAQEAAVGDVEPVEEEGGGVAVDSNTVESVLENLAAAKPTMLDRFRRDPVGNGLSVAVLVGMIVSIVAVARSRRPTRDGFALSPVVPLLALMGLGVAGYLAYVESADVAAVCGPIGNCNEVQQSDYARVFDLIPVGVVGLIGYAAIIGAWLAVKFGNRVLAARAVLLLGAITMAGTLFSLYLTFLEPFVIGATCAWCLTSAVLITVLMILSAGETKAAWRAMRTGYRRVARSGAPLR